VVWRAPSKATEALVKPNDFTHQIIGAAIDVHREIGPGRDEDALEVAFRTRRSGASSSSGCSKTPG